MCFLYNVSNKFGGKKINIVFKSFDVCDFGNYKLPRYNWIFVYTNSVINFYKNPKNYKANIVDIVKSGLIAGMAVIVDFAIVAIVENLIGTKQTRLSDFTRIFLNIKIILKNTKDVLTKTCNLYPENLFIIWIIALLAILFVYEIKNKDELIKEKS